MLLGQPPPPFFLKIIDVQKFTKICRGGEILIHSDESTNGPFNLGNFYLLVLGVVLLFLCKPLSGIRAA